MLIWIILVAVALIALVVGFLADANRPGKRFCVWVDWDGNVRCKTRGDLGEINNYELKVFVYLSERAAFSEKVNRRILKSVDYAEADVFTNTPDLGQPD